MDGSRKLKIIALGTASAVHLVGLATPTWALVKISGDSHYYGLWQHCYHSGVSTRKCRSPGEEDTDSIRSVQVLESVGLLGLVISIIISSVLKCFKKDVTLNHKALTIINVVIICGAGICIMTGVVVFGTSDFNASFRDFEKKPHGDLGYSFFLCTGASGFLLVIYTPMLVYDICRRVKPEKNRKNLTHDKDKSDFSSVCPRHSTSDFAGYDEISASPSSAPRAT